MMCSKMIQVCICVYVYIYLIFHSGLSPSSRHSLLPLGFMEDTWGKNGNSGRFYFLQFTHSVVSDSLRPHGLQHARLPCPSPTPGAYSNSCPLSWWCHPTISSSVVLFSSIFLGSTIGADSDGSHEIKRCLPLQRKAMTNLDSLLKSRDISLDTMVCKVKAMVFLVFVYGCESWTIKKADKQRTDTFELWCWRRLLRVPWTPGRSNQSTVKEINPEYSLEGLMLKVKLQYFGYLMWLTVTPVSGLTGKDLGAGNALLKIYAYMQRWLVVF